MFDNIPMEYNDMVRESLKQIEPILQFFEYAHLPDYLQKISKPFSMIAYGMVELLPRNSERTAALRKLLEAKDCAVRSKLYK